MGRIKNTFKFVGFNDRINSIRIDTILRCGSYSSSKPQFAEAFFFETLEKWSDLNGTRHFDSFKKSIPRSDIRSYAQLLHYQKEIAEALKSHLNVENSLCLPALLELTVAFCRDLQSDFYAYFWDFFEVIKTILDRSTLQDTDLLESCFTCYAYLFKYCWRKLITDLNNVFSRFLPLLSHKKSYIRRFACESAAFLVRKCPDLKSFADVCSNYVKENLATEDSIATLFYESMKSVKGILHTSSPQVYSILIDSYSRDNKDLGFLITKLLTEKLIEFTKTNCLEPLLEVLLEKTGELKDHENLENSKEMVIMLEIWSLWTNGRNGTVVKFYFNQIFDRFLLPALDWKFLSNSEILEPFLSLVVEIYNFTSENNSEKIGTISFWNKFLAKFSSTCSSYPLTLVVNFYQKILIDEKISYSNLIAEFCERNLTTSESIHARSTILNFLCNLCHSEFDESSSDNIVECDFSNSKQFGPQFWAKTPTMCSLIVSILDKIDNLKSNPEEFLCALYLYAFFGKDHTLLLKIVCTISDEEFQLHLEQRFFGFILVVRILKRIKMVEDNFKNVNFSFIINQIKCHTGESIALNAAICFLDSYPNIFTELLTNKEFLQVSESNLLSPLFNIRLNTIKALSKFYWTDSLETNMFDIMLECELIPLTLSTYRDKLICYRKLGAAEYEHYLPEKTAEFRSAVLMFLFGQLNVNFSLLLPTINEVIESHARAQAQEQFWTVFSRVLHYVHEKHASERNGPKTIRDSLIAEKAPENVENGEKMLVFSFCDSILKILTPTEERVSGAENLRLLLWKTMENFPDLAESKTRFLSDLVLDLARNELNLKMDCERFEDLTSSNQSQNNIKNEKQKRDESNLVYKTLVSCLNVYSKFNDIKNISKEKDMRSLYFDLLLNRRFDIQQAALNCILAYKWEAVNPYNSHLKNLLDDKLLKEELVLLNIDSESNVVDADHRISVMPILFRLLYGILMRKSSDSQRREQIYRFLAGCSNDELNTFFDLLFSPLKHYITLCPLDQTCEEILSSYDVSKSIPFRKLRGIVSHLETIIPRLAFALEAYRSSLFRVCCVIGAIIVKIQAEKEKILPYYAKSVKSLCRQLIFRFAEYFSHFESCELAESEISTMFNICLFPLLRKLEAQNSLVSSDLIKLGLVWSENPRFFILLGTYKSGSNNYTLLEILVRSLENESSNAKLRASIATIIFNLLNLADYESENKAGGLLTVPNGFDVKYVKPEGVQMDTPLNFGTQLVLPYADLLLRLLSSPSLLPRISRNEKWTKILNVLTEFADTVENCDQLLTILLSIVQSQKNRNLAVEENILSSIECLLRKVSDKRQFEINIAELFLLIKRRSPREKLLAIFTTLAESNCHLEKIREIILDLNSWDTKTLEEPDYNRRLKACVKLNKLFKADPLDNVQCCFITHCCFHMIIHSNDNVLRDNAGVVLRNLIEQMSEKFEKENGIKFVTLYILPSIRKFLKSKDENIRHELLNVLSACVKCYPEHPKLTGLYELLDVGDLDVNFFENIRHIQLHRRYRAIHRLCEKLDDASTSVSSESLLRFIWPLCYSFIFDPAFSKNTTLIQESVRFLGIYCRRSPWKRYESMLKYYLQLLRKDPERQKLIVKMIVVILDAFHFNVKDNSSASMDKKIFKYGKQPIEPSSEDTVDAEKDSGQRIQKILTKDIVPKLRNCLTKRTSTDVAHRTNKKAVYDEDEEILRVPLALALVKLFQKLGDAYLEANLSNVLTKICQMLKSRSFDIREMTRKVLSNIATSLGPRYLPYIIREMRAILKRGYQLHVLTFTVNFLLDCLAPNLTSGNLDPCLDDILAIAKDDLFGEVSEQKEVDEITKNLKEAKARKTCQLFKIIGQFISSRNLEKTVGIFKEVLEQKFSHKIVQTVNDALKHFAQGLILNSSFNVEFLMTFVLKILQEHVSCLNNINKTSMENVDNDQIAQKSCLIIEPEPRRTGVIPKRSKSSGLHVLVIFGLEILDTLLKNNATEISKPEYHSLLDPFINLYFECLNVKQTKVVILSMRCLSSSLKYPLVSLRENCQKIVQQVFVLLSRFAGLSRVTSGGENGELMSVLFKAITTIIRDLDYATINNKQLKILLSYVDEDLFDAQKQSTAFNLVKAILSRKLISPEIKPLMQRIEHLCVESQTTQCRQQCRSILEKYLKNYPEGKRPKRIIEFFCAQLDYEYENGRLSALEMINLIINTFKTDQLSEFGLFLFITLSLRLVNDDSTVIRRTASELIKKLIDKFNDNLRTSVFQIVFEWLSDKKMLHKKLAAHLLSLLTNKMTLSTVSQAISLVIDVIKSISCDKDGMDNSSNVALSDHTIFLLLTFLENVLTGDYSTIIRDPKFVNEMNAIWELLIQSLDHDHVWVQFVSCKILGILLPQYKSDEISTPPRKTNEYFLTSPNRSVKILCDKLLHRLRSLECTPEIAEQVIKNLSYLSRHIRNLQKTAVPSPSDDLVPADSDSTAAENVVEQGKKFHTSLKWLTVQLCRICRFEIINSPQQYIKRTNVFKWFAGLLLHSTSEEIIDFLPIILPLLHRATTLADEDPSLKQLATEVVEMIKDKIGMEIFVDIWTKVHSSKNEKRAERKRKLAEQAITDPEMASKRKLRKHKTQKEARKRKFMSKKGKVKNFKRLKNDSVDLGDY